jgi:hypothetical protein
MEGIISHLSQLYAFWRISNPYTEGLLPVAKKLINPKQLHEEVKKTKASTGKLVQAEMTLDLLERLVQSDFWRFYINIFHILTELDTKGEFPLSNPRNASFCKKVEKIYREKESSGELFFSS